MGDAEGDRLGSHPPAIEPRIKWPNDVRVDGRKVAGILLERGHGTVIGIGLNVNLDPSEFPPDLRSPATSLRALHGRPLDRSAVVRNLIRRLDQNYDQGLRLGRDHLGSAYCRFSEHQGRRVEIEAGEARHVGRLSRTDLRDGLTLVRDDGSSVLIPIEEVASIANRPELDRGGG